MPIDNCGHDFDLLTRSVLPQHFSPLIIRGYLGQGRAAFLGAFGYDGN
jgi:hypothetical protein